jgi:hypothetical protein
MLQSAVHQAIVVVDVEGFGDPARTNAHQLTVCDAMYQALRRSFALSRISWSDCTTEDRGDGVLILVSSEIPKSWLVTGLSAHLAEALTWPAAVPARRRRSCAGPGRSSNGLVPPRRCQRPSFSWPRTGGRRGR